MLEIVNYLRISNTARIPTMNKSGSFSLYSSVPATILPYERRLLTTDIIVALPGEMSARIGPRKCLLEINIDVGATVLNSKYCGPLLVLLINNSLFPLEVKVGDNVAEITFERVVHPLLIEVQSIETTAGLNTC